MTQLLQKKNLNKTKNVVKPLDYTRLENSSKRKQRLHEKLLNRRYDKDENAYKIYKNLFQKLKLQSKKLYFQNKLKQYENTIKIIWKIMKVIISKSKVYNDNFSSLKIGKKKLLTRKKTIAERFNSYYKILNHIFQI